jgi:uncharacterized membrane protein
LGSQIAASREVTDRDGNRRHGSFRITASSPPSMPPDAGLYTVAFGIDDSGKTVGGYVDDRGRLRGFLKDKEAFTLIDFPGAKATFAARINNRGQIVGAYSEESNTPALNLSHGFLLEDGVFTRIDVPGARRTQPFGIDNHGQIVGGY